MKHRNRLWVRHSELPDEETRLSDDEQRDDAAALGADRPSSRRKADPTAPWERPWAMAPRLTPPPRAHTADETTADESTAADAKTTQLPRVDDSPRPPVTTPSVPTRLQVKRARRRRRSTRFRRGTAALVALLVFFVTGAAWGATKYLDYKVNKVDALDQNSSSVLNRDGQRGDENYLLVGSDSRAGSNGEVGAGSTADAGGARSDTVMLAHVPADRGRVVVVSFPRDLEIDRPACAEWDNNTAKYSATIDPGEKQSKLNAAYSTGGPKCLVQVIQQISGLKINHFVGVDFSGFEALVNQIGGVQVCTTRPLVDDELGTILPNAGTQLINGATALSYVRARKVDAEGTGDYGRIKRQQRFLSSLLRKSMSTDVLLNFGKLTGFINGFTAATFGQNMNSDSLITLGQSLQGLSAGRVTFITVPTTGTRYGNEIPNLKEIRTIFQAIIDDTPLPGEEGPAKPSTTPAPTPAPVKPGGSAKIGVLNGTVQAGLAGTTAEKLTGVGYTVDTTGTAPSVTSSSSVQYSGAQADAAKQLAGSIPGAQLQEDDSLGDTVTVVLGQDFAGEVKPPDKSSPTPAPLPSDLSVVNAGDTSCD